MLAGVGRVDWQRDVDEQLADEEPAAGLAVEHQGVLADPAEAGLFGDGLFQHRRTVDEGAMAKRADDRLDALGQLLQALAHQLVVVAAQRVARHVGLLGLRQALGHPRIAGQVVHTQRHHAQRAGYQLIRVRALAAVRGHVVHLALVAGIQPALQVRLVLAEVDVGDADLLEAQLAPPVLDGLRQLRKIGRGVGHGGAARQGRWV